MKRSRPKKRSRKASWYINKLDAFAREKIVVERDGNKCVKCPRAAPKWQIQWSHVYTRKNRAIRWNPDNSKALCASCHFWWEQNPVEATEWFMATFPERYERLQKVKNLVAPPIEIQYEQVLAELGS